jgi:hypothetical protein
MYLSHMQRYVDNRECVACPKRAWAETLFTTIAHFTVVVLRLWYFSRTEALGTLAAFSKAVSEELYHSELSGKAIGELVSRLKWKLTRLARKNGWERIH